MDQEELVEFLVIRSSVESEKTLVDLVTYKTYRVTESLVRAIVRQDNGGQYEIEDTDIFDEIRPGSTLYCDGVALSDDGAVVTWVGSPKISHKGVVQVESLHGLAKDSLSDTLLLLLEYLNVDVGVRE